MTELRKAPLKPALELEDDLPESPKTKIAIEAEMKTPRSSYLVWNTDLSPEQGLFHPPNRSMHEFGKAHLGLFLTEVSRKPKAFETEICRRRRAECAKSSLQRLAGWGRR